MGRFRKIVVSTALGIAMAAFGQNANAVEVNETGTFKASADEVWAVVKQFGDIHKWHPWFADTTTFGADGVFYRRIVTPDGGWALETLDAYSWADKSITYSVVDGVFPIANYTATISVSSAGSGSTINWVSSFDAVGMPEADVQQLIIDAYQAGFQAVAAATGE
ncbi:MAG: SRPBCC family protein [Alphaproteobacteria bacterium]|jgi:hypothetical protein|nr:SRPBCC family protein [Alphaproteobacteria bacterium]